MDASFQQDKVETYLLFISDAVILQDIAEEIGLQKPAAAILTVASLGEFMAVVQPNVRLCAAFVELELLGSYWIEAWERMRGLGARVILLGNAIEDMADRGVHVAGVRTLLRPYSGEDVARLVVNAPPC